MWQSVLRVPTSSSVSRHWMTSVVFDRLSVFAFLTAWGVVFHRMTDPLDRFWIVQKDSFCLAVYSGLACRPAVINLLVGLFVCLCPSDSNPGWGDWSRSFRGWGGFLFCWFSVCLSKLMSVLLLVTRLGLMPCSAWSKKNTVNNLLQALDLLGC